MRWSPRCRRSPTPNSAPRPTSSRQQLANGATLDDLLVPAFAVVREAAKRALGMRPFDVQLIGGMVLHCGAIAEMRTGEGKTLVATLPVYLNALAGKGVHVVTVNDYLAKRDAEWMGRIYAFLGLTTGVIVHGISDDERRAAYACDVTYGTNNELGFDYLRDNMKYERAQMVQRGHNYAIVDEVDSILIDEARTPLIISGPLEDRSEMYNTVDALILQLQPEDYEIDEKQRTAIFTEDGTEKLENMLRAAGQLKGESLYDVENVAIVHHVNNALKAHRLFQKDKDYIVRNGEIVIIDEFTGRMMPGRRYSEGLHQALEAKEHVAIQPENQTLASVTFQNYFRMYEKLAGMTGTAATEAEEFGNIYGLDVAEVPTNLPVIRLDEDDEVYRTVEEKYKAIVQRDPRSRAKGQPILVGTTSIEKSEQLAERLRKEGIKDFQVLNARYHEQEASSSPRPACRAPSPSPPTWPAAAPTSSSAATPTCASRRSSPTCRQGAERDGQGNGDPRRRRSGSRTRRSPPAASTCSPPSATKAAASTTSCAAVPAARATPAARNSSCRCRTT